VTSDKAEQDSVLGSGAYRISAREFREIYYKTKKEIEERIDKLPGSTGRRELGGRIDDEVALFLEKLRRR
jgi:predicted RNA-binding protein with PIN domain